MTMAELMDQGLLTKADQQEMLMWFQASSRAQVPMELPDHLWLTLRNAMALAELDLQEASMH